MGFGALERLYPMLFPSPFAAALHGVPLLLQSLELWGAAPLSMLLVLVNVRVAELAREIVRRTALARAARLLGFALLTWIALALYGSLRSAQVREQVAHAPSLRIGVVQANLGTHEKRRDHAGALRKHIVLSRALIAREQPDLLIWPETALPGLLAVDTTQLFLPLGFHVPLLTGAVVYHHLGTRTLLHNSAFLLDADQHVIARSDKIRLVPFAERLPFGEQYPVLYDLVPGAGQFTPGRAPVALQLNGKRIAALICYEDILPDLVRDVMERAQPQLLVNITNDAWFGDTPAPHYHLSLSTLRTIEQRRFLVRATNSGVSAIVDPTGAVLQATRTFEQATLSARVALLSTTTPYARSGDLLGWTAVLACAWLLLGRMRRRA
jgi:apolipoprotein N-acyltransferase